MPPSRTPQSAENAYACSFEVKHDCVVGNLSRRLPDLAIYHWCVPNRSFFQVSGPADQMKDFREWALDDCDLMHHTNLPESDIFITRRCCKVFTGRPITEMIEDIGAFDIPPLLYHGGWESWRIIVWDGSSIRRLFNEIRDHAEFRVHSMKPIKSVELEKMMLLPASDVFSGLTERQLDALVLGLEQGYFSLPSETSLEALARGFGVSPSTLAEHIRKAEKRVLRNLLPYLQAYSSKLPGAPVLGQLPRQIQGVGVEST